ncbi:MAG: copper homeostasis protein CutC [Alistipes shahii]
MAEEIASPAPAEPTGSVLGALTPPVGEVDETRTAQLVREAEGMEVTFHRAFDMTRDPRQALGSGHPHRMPPGAHSSGGRNTAQRGRRRTLRALWRRRTKPAPHRRSWPGSGARSVERPAWLGRHRGVDAPHFQRPPGT